METNQPLPVDASVGQQYVEDVEAATTQRDAVTRTGPADIVHFFTGKFTAKGIQSETRLCKICMYVCFLSFLSLSYET